MKKLLILILLQGVVTIGFSQEKNKAKKVLTGIEFFNGIAWSNKENHTSRYIYSFDLILDYEILKGFMIGTGIGMSKFGHQKEEIETIVVIDYTDIKGYPCVETHRGIIPTRRRKKNRFIKIPFRTNITVYEKDKLSISLYNSLTFNIYHDDKTDSWFWYNTENEVRTSSNDINYGFRGNFWGFNSAFRATRDIFNGLNVSLDFQHQLLFFESKFPQTQEKVRFHNIGVNIGLNYNLNYKRHTTPN